MGVFVLDLSKISRYRGKMEKRCKNGKELWNSVHVIKAIDGRHMAVECQKKSSSLYYNYKGFCSLL